MRHAIFSKPSEIAAASLCLMGTSACMGPPMGGPGMVQSGPAPQAVASFDPTGANCVAANVWSMIHCDRACQTVHKSF